MFNILLSALLDLFLPLDTSIDTIPRKDMQNAALNNSSVQSRTLNTGTISSSEISGIAFSLNEPATSLPVPDGSQRKYLTGWRKHSAANFTAISISSSARAATVHAPKRECILTLHRKYMQGLLCCGQAAQFQD